MQNAGIAATIVGAVVAIVALSVAFTQLRQDITASRETSMLIFRQLEIQETVTSLLESDNSVSVEPDTAVAEEVAMLLATKDALKQQMSNGVEASAADADTGSVAILPEPTDTPTPVPPTPLPTNTPFPTNTPTPKPIPTAVPTPIDLEGLPVLFSDDFSDPTTGWYLCGGEYGDDELVLRQHHTTFGCETTARPNLMFDDFVLAVDTRWSGGAVGGTWRVRFRHSNNDNMYSFELTNSGRYAFWKGTRGDWTLLRESFTEAIDRSGGVNRVQIESLGSDIRAFINGQFVVSIDDEDHDIGDIEFYVNRPDGSQFFEVIYDNVIVTMHPGQE